MKDCKNRRADQRHTWERWEEKEIISSERQSAEKKKVGLAAHVCLKANLQERHGAQRLLWEPGAQNHLRSTDAPPTRASAPSAAAINV